MGKNRSYGYCLFRYFLSLNINYFPSWSYFQVFSVMHVIKDDVWNRLVSLRHWWLTRGHIIAMFVGLISVPILAHRANYQPIEIYMKNSTSLVCTVNDLRMRSFVDAATICNRDDVCRALDTLTIVDGGDSFAFCKCMTKAQDTAIVYSNLYMSQSSLFNKGKTHLTLMEWNHDFDLLGLVRCVFDLTNNFRLISWTDILSVSRDIALRLITQDLTDD